MVELTSAMEAVQIQLWRQASLVMQMNRIHKSLLISSKIPA
jgi:hypothetical protein